MSDLSDLADFLLNRIAEDEDEARLGVGWADRSTRWGRVLAECDAKRALVLELARMLRDEAGWDGIEEKVMGYLALPYADHEQYRQEWRP